MPRRTEYEGQVPGQPIVGGMVTCSRRAHGQPVPVAEMQPAGGWCRACARGSRSTSAASASASPSAATAATSTSVAAQTISNRRFGVELEMTRLEVSAFRASMASAGIALQDGSYSTRAEQVGAWVLKHDGSVGGQGLELVSPPLQGADGFRTLERVCEMLAQHGARTGASCGLHVHLDATPEGGTRVAHIRRMMAGWVTQQGILRSQVTASRIGSQWCGDVPASDVPPESITGRTDLVAFARNRSRYRNLSLYQLAVHGTLENRWHHGTVRYRDISRWVALLQAAFDSAAADDGRWTATYEDAAALAAALNVTLPRAPRTARTTTRTVSERDVVLQERIAWHRANGLALPAWLQAAASRLQVAV